MHDTIAEWITHGQVLLDKSVNKIRVAKNDFDDAMLNDVEMLLLNGVTPNTPNSENLATPLHVAARCQSEVLVFTLCEHGASLTAVNCYGATPLHNASREAPARIVKFLIKKGSHINARTTNGDTPLHQAMRNNRKGNVCALVLAGADATVKNKDGQTPQQIPQCSPTTRAAYFEAIDQGPEAVVH